MRRTSIGTLKRAVLLLTRGHSASRKGGSFSTYKRCKNYGALRAWTLLRGCFKYFNLHGGHVDIFTTGGIIYAGGRQFAIRYMPVIRQILLFVFSQLILTIGTAQSSLDSIANDNFQKLIKHRSFSNKELYVLTREEYYNQQARGGGLPSYYYTDVRHLFFRLDSTFEEVIQYPDLGNLNSDSDLYSFKDTCFLKEGFIAFSGNYSVLRDTIYANYLQVFVFDNLAYGYLDPVYSGSSNYLPLSKQYISQFIICRFDAKKTKKFIWKNSELYDMTGRKWFGFK